MPALRTEDVEAPVKGDLSVPSTEDLYKALALKTNRAYVSDEYVPLFISCNMLLKFNLNCTQFRVMINPYNAQNS